MIELVNVESISQPLQFKVMGTTFYLGLQTLGWRLTFVSV